MSCMSLEHSFIRPKLKQKHHKAKKTLFKSAIFMEHNRAVRFDKDLIKHVYCNISLLNF